MVMSGLPQRLVLDPVSVGTAASDGGDPNTLLVIVLLAAGTGIAFAVLSGVVRRTKRQVDETKAPQIPAPAAPATPPPVDPRRQLAGTARWFHDQLSLELLALPNAEAAQRWAAQQRRIEQLSIALRAEASHIDPEIWGGLATSVDELASSLDTALRIKASEHVDGDLVDEAVTIANRHRGDLHAWLDAAERSIV